MFFHSYPQYCLKQKTLMSASNIDAYSPFQNSEFEKKKSSQNYGFFL